MTRSLRRGQADRINRLIYANRVRTVAEPDCDRRLAGIRRHHELLAQRQDIA